MNRKCSILLLTFVSCVMYAGWQSPVSNFTLQQYNAGTQNWQIKNHPSGWVYVANNNGVVEFDGVRFSTYGISYSSPVRAMYIDSKGNIYAGGTNEFGVFETDSLGKLYYKSVSNTYESALGNFGEIWKICQYKNYICYQTRHNLFLFDEDGKLKVVNFDEYIYTVEVLSNELYVATTEGLFALNSDESRTQIANSKALFSSCEVRTMQVLNESEMLIATDSKGLWLFSDGKINRYHTNVDKFILENQLYTLAINNEYIAYGTVRKGAVVTKRNGDVVEYINMDNGLQNNTVLSLNFNTNNDLWLGLDNGLSVVSLNSPNKFLDDKIDYGSGYHSIYHNGKLYLSTNQGLYITDYNAQDHSIGDLELIKGSIGQAWKTCVIDDVILCCHNKGLFIVAGNQLKQIIHGDGIWNVEPLSDDYFIAGGYTGFYLLKKEGYNMRLMNKIEGFDNTAFRFVVDAKQNIWVISQKGLDKLLLSSDRRKFETENIHPFNPSHSYIELSKINNEVIISSDDYCAIVNRDGLLQDGKEFFNQLDGEHLYRFICQDKLGNIYYVSANELKMLQYDIVARKYYNDEKLLLSTQNFIGGFVNVNVLNGVAVVGVVNGFYKINTQQKSDIPSGEFLCIRSIVNLPKNEVIYGENYDSCAAGNELVLPYQKSYSLRFDFGGVSEINNELIYKTRLRPLEDEYIASNHPRREILTDEEGNYHLDVQLYLADGTLLTSRDFVFRITPPWWRTWWMFIVYILCFAILILLVYYSVDEVYNKRHNAKLNSQAMEAKAREAILLAEQQKQKIKILQLEHDKTEIELHSKTEKLSSVMLSQLDKNELVNMVKADVAKVEADIKVNDISAAQRHLALLQNKLNKQVAEEVNWQRFEENFDVANGNFTRKLQRQFPWMTKQERRLCVYIHMGMVSKEIAPLMGITIRGVEMMRYRMRIKMNLPEQANLKSFLNEIAESDKTDE